MNLLLVILVVELGLNTQVSDLLVTGLVFAILSEITFEDYFDWRNDQLVVFVIFFILLEWQNRCFIQIIHRCFQPFCQLVHFNYVFFNTAKCWKQVFSNGLILNDASFLISVLVVHIDQLLVCCCQEELVVDEVLGSLQDPFEVFII